MFETLKVSRSGDHVVNVEICRPDTGNAMNGVFWKEFREFFEDIRHDGQCRCVVVSAKGKFFSVGLDLADFAQTSQMGSGKADSVDSARRGWSLRRTVTEMQQTFTAMEECPQPVIVACHSAVIGGAVDLVCAADIRICSEDTFFSIKEVDVGLAADVGTLQRIQHVMGNSSLARELCYTARRMGAKEAMSAGFVSSVYPDRGATIQAAMDMAHVISIKSPIAVAGTKVNLNYSRDHTVRDSLEYMATWNAAMLQTEDLRKAAEAWFRKSKTPPKFSKL